MTVLMNKSHWRLMLVSGAAMLLAGCGSKETKEALQKSSTLQGQQQYQDANNVLVEALRAREAKLRADAGSPTDPAAIDALTKKVQADKEILKMERSQIPLYLLLGRADLASAVYSDILSGNPGDPVIYNTLHDKDPKIRTGAVQVLGLAAKPDAIDALAQATKDSAQDVRRAAATALGSIKDPRTVDPLIAALKDSYWFVRSEAANALGQKHDPRAVKPLLDTVTDSDSSVESSAETALLSLCTEKNVATDDFAAHLTDPNPKLILISAVCLSRLKDPRALPVLIQQVNSSPDLQTRLEVLKALGETGDPSVIPALRQTLKDKDVNMQGWSIIGLGNLKDQGSLTDLQAIAANPAEPPKIRAAAAASVGAITGQPPSPVAP